MNVSVIIPAHNASGTLAETLQSVQAQTFKDWEVVVVDDGSSDGTPAIAAGFAERDHRIRVVRQSKMGVSAARNAGIKLAQYDWLLFLDSDDMILPTMLERMTTVLASNPRLDIVHCGWAYSGPDGKRFADSYWFQPESGNIFPAFAQTCPFTIHACIVRKSIVNSLGGFDTSLVTCEDWDLWQQIARTGAHFGAVREVLSMYRMRQDSATKKCLQLTIDGLRVIERGYSFDARVPNPLPENRNGAPSKEMQGVKLYHVCWAAGLVLGRGQDARPLLGALDGVYDPELDPAGVAATMLESLQLATCLPITAVATIWQNIEQHIGEFLSALEHQSKAFRLARRTSVALKRLILERSTAVRPITLGTTHAIRIEVTEPIKDFFPPVSIERLNCTVELEGVCIGTIDLPVCDGIVSRFVIADAIAAEYFWKIIGRFFEHTVYHSLNVRQEKKGVSLWRGTLCIADNLPENDSMPWLQVHERCGWMVFLQEIWGRPDWPENYFYDPKTVDSSAARLSVNEGWVTIEAGNDIPDIEVHRSALKVLLTVGGAAVGVVTVPVKDDMVRAQEIRAALTVAGGVELCRIAVREGVLGMPMTGQPATLRNRLAVAASTAAQGDGKGSIFEKNERYIPVSGSVDMLNCVLSQKEEVVVFGRRAYGEIGTSTSRRAMFPASVAPELIDAATVAGEPVIQIPKQCKNPSRIVYAPDLILCPPLQEQVFVVDKKSTRADKPCDTSIYGRDHFERIFEARFNPRRYTSLYEQKKYEQALEMLPSWRIGRAIEISCAEGHFTEQLASRVDNLIAADISQIAIDRDIKHCADVKNVQFVWFDLTKDPLPGHFELIVCREVLYYMNGRKALKAVARKLVKALEPWGYLLMVHVNIIKDDPDHTGFDWKDVSFGAKAISETFRGVPLLRLVKELRTPLYRIQLFQRVPRIWSLLYSNTPEVVELKQQPTGLLLEVRAQVKWQHGNHPGQRKAAQTVVTERLPILMYHRVTPAGLPETARYRVTPESFEEQLKYLRDAGYYSIGLEDWYTAMVKKTPLPGKAVMITFDDGYVDFLTYAWPLLKRYGFSTTVFLVADCVGQTNSWDGRCQEEIPLLGWKDILQLRDEGVVFGSHSVSHPFLTELSPENIVREGARSRAILERELGIPVRAFAYPYGDTDRVVQHLIGACGYIFGLSCREALSSYNDPLLALPRFEVSGSDKIRDFIKKLSVRPAEEMS